MTPEQKQDLYDTVLLGVRNAERRSWCMVKKEDIAVEVCRLLEERYDLTPKDPQVEDGK